MTWWRRWIGGDGFVSWTQQIQVWTADRPLDLPPIRPLVAVKAKRTRKAIDREHARRRALFRRVG